MKHVVSLSGGKDSTAMLLRMIELDMPIDEVRYFDAGSWEFPQVHRHIDKLEKHIGLPIKRMKHRYSFDYGFSKHVKTRGPRKGEKGYGFPSMRCRWCTRWKLDTLNKGFNRKEDLWYIGYSTDDISRVKKRDEARYPLLYWGWSSKDCLDYCYSKRFDWEGLYTYFRRVSCWCCPLQGIQEFRNLKTYFPELWNRLIEMQEMRSEWSFLMNGRSVHDLDRRFEKERQRRSLGL